MQATISEQLVHAYFNQLEKSDKVAIDIGANHGIYTRYLCDKFSKVIAVEPIEKNITILKKNCSQFTNLEIVQKVVSDKSGKVQIHLNQQNDGGHTLNEKISSVGEAWGFLKDEILEVESVTLDELCKGLDVGTLKVDVEGAENLVFDPETAKETLARPKLNIMLETHLAVDLEKLYDTFDKNGFVIFGLGVVFGVGESRLETMRVTSFYPDNHYICVKQ